jgi:SAM-dependent methyltransferase
MSSDFIEVLDFPDLKRNYFSNTPLPHALFRCAEILPLCGSRFMKPVLDLGCGTGEFPEMSLRGKLDIGLDISSSQLALARKTGRYQRLVRADAKRTPFSAKTFNTVVSISALEHMVGVGAILKEITRVLAPSGILVATVTLAATERSLYYPHVFRRLGMHWAARKYEQMHRRCFRHRALLSEHDWELLLRESGLIVTESMRVVCPELISWWDFLLPAAFPSWLMRRLRGHYPAPQAWIGNRISMYCDALLNDLCDGCVLLFKAKSAEC